MPYNLILLPLLGGFWFSVLCYRTRFRAMQAPRHLFLFHAATAGLVFAGISRALTVSLSQALDPATLAQIKATMLPWDYSGTALLAAVLGPVAAGIWNYFDSREAANRSAIQRFGSPLEKTLLEAQDGESRLMFTMQSGKVYVGQVVTTPANLEGAETWLQIAPFFSGYRSADHKVNLTTNYFKVMEEMAEREHHFSDEDFLRTVRVADIASVSAFDADVWNRFNPVKRPKPKLPKILDRG